jgi:hypothetical protein
MNFSNLILPMFSILPMPGVEPLMGIDSNVWFQPCLLMLDSIKRN